MDNGTDNRRLWWVRTLVAAVRHVVFAPELGANTTFGSKGLSVPQTGANWRRYGARRPIASSSGVPITVVDENGVGVGDIDVAWPCIRSRSVAVS